MKTSIRNWLVVITTIFVATASAFASNFTQGNLVVLRYGDGTAGLTTAAAPMSVLELTTNGRGGQVINNQLWYSTGSGTVGIYNFTGTPPTTASTAVLQASDTGTSPSCWDFAINSAGTIMYVADTRTFANGGGVRKYTQS